MDFVVLFTGRSVQKNEHGRWDYRVKWSGLPYSESTWEDDELLSGQAQAQIDEFHMRQENPRVPKRENKVSSPQMNIDLTSIAEFVVVQREIYKAPLIVIL